MQVTLDGSIPTGGIKLTRTYKSALPDGVTATLAYYNEQLGTWLAVPSTLSEDRKSVTAVVHHLSLWTDVVGVVGPVTQGISSAVTSAADWAYYQVGKVFDTRVDPPTCSGKPEWLDSSAFIATDRNNPLLFCVGSDPKHRSVLDVKARVNRGFAYTAYLNVTPSWTYNSTFDNHSLSDAVSTIGHLDQALSDTWAAFSPKGAVLVGPGEELSFGVSEQGVRSAGSSTVLHLVPPSTVSFLVSILGQLIGTQLHMMADGYVAGLMAVSGCYSDVHAAKDLGTYSRAAVTCMSNLDEAIAKTFATYLTKRGADPAAAGKEAGAVVGRISIYLALVGPVFSTMNFIGERSLPASARTVDVYPTIQTVSAATLRSAEVPADCHLPAQRLKNNATTLGSPGSGSLVDPVGYADFAGLGYKQVLAVYLCNAGGVAWPEVLVLVGSGGKLFASLDLGSLVGRCQAV